MSGYMFMTGSPFLQDITKQDKETAAQIAAAQLALAGRKASIMLGEDVPDAEPVTRTATASTKGSTDSEEAPPFKRGFGSIFQHRRRKRSKDIKPDSASTASRFDLLSSFRPSSPISFAGLRSNSLIPPDAIRPTSPTSLRVVSPVPGELPEIRTSLDSTPSIHSAHLFNVDTPEPKTNLSAIDILVGGLESIPPRPPPKSYVSAFIPNPKEDPIMSSLSPTTIVKTSNQRPMSPGSSSISHTQLPPLQTRSDSIFSASGSERQMSIGSEEPEMERLRKGSESSEFDGEKDKKRQHWLVPSSPHTNIIDEKLYNELPLDLSEVPLDPGPGPSTAAAAPRPEKDPAMFAQRADSDDEYSSPPPPFEEEETIPKPEFSENLKEHLRGSDLAGNWWRLYAPPPELSYVPESTPIELLNLYNDEQLEFDIRRIQGLPPVDPDAELQAVPRSKRSDSTEESCACSDDISYNSHRASTHTAEGTIFSRRSVATTATSVSDAGAPENASPISPTQPSAAAMARWTAFSKWGPSIRDSLPAYSPMRESFMNMNPLSPNPLNQRKNENGCAMCMEDLSVRRTVIIDCQHKFCTACLRSIVLASLNDEISFPPKCCTTRIPVRAIRAVCNLSEQAAVNHKIREYSQDPADRIYCPSSACGRFIPPEPLHDFRSKCLVCQFCQAKVCPTCRGRAHAEGAVCPKEEQELCTGCEMSGDNCLCKFDEEGLMDWGKTRLYESGNLDELDRQAGEIHSATHGHVQPSMADMGMGIGMRRDFERKVSWEQLAAEESLRNKRDKEKQERKRKEEAQITDLSKRYDKLMKQLENLLEAQSTLMEQRLELVRAGLMAGHEEGEAQLEAILAEEDETLEARLAERAIDLESRLDEELKQLDAKFEEEEDDIIIILTRQHRGKPNRDERIKSAVDRLKLQQSEEKQDVKSQYSTQLSDLRKTVISEIEQIKQEIIQQRQADLEGQYEEWHEAARREYADEKWFAAVREIRKEHLAIQFEAQKDECRRKKLEAELEESFKLAMMLEMEDERDKVYSSGRQSHLKMPMF
ncbi:hypothetical protein Dda_1500 [Drechslerella dactyloides]|uniref:RING-type domain-containing protein n=1 Tax=Drechslerella dactyloides TaxID=74499 RepID=A0AAD6NLV5_DREDA|nr:hypothetical protein Dda_1500 [Drechslerella dactyloides]